MFLGSCVLFALVLMLDCNGTTASSTSDTSDAYLTLQGMVKCLYGSDLSKKPDIMSMIGLDGMYRDHVAQTGSRHKRQAGGKYTEAAGMGQTKSFRLQLQMIKNTFAKTYVGGPHPLHPLIPYTFVELLTEKVIKYFSPDITAAPKQTQ